MLFAALVLVSIEGEHDCLEECVDLGQADETAEGGNVSRFGLEEEEEVGVLLELALVGEVTFGGVHIFKMLFDFVLLKAKLASLNDISIQGSAHFVESHTVLDKQPNAGI